MNNKKIYRHIADLPSGTASDTLTEGCLVLEGGGWKGLYTVGVLDCMMKNDINFSSVVGVSAGALSAIGYVSGQIGWGARIDLTYRHDKNYCGIGAFKRDKGITGFSYLFDVHDTPENGFHREIIRWLVAFQLHELLAPPRFSPSRPHCDVCGWTEVSLSFLLVIAHIRSN